MEDGLAGIGVIGQPGLRVSGWVSFHLIFFACGIRLRVLICGCSHQEVPMFTTPTYFMIAPAATGAGWIGGV